MRMTRLPASSVHQLLKLHGCMVQQASHHTFQSVRAVPATTAARRTLSTCSRTSPTSSSNTPSSSPSMPATVDLNQLLPVTFPHIPRGAKIAVAMSAGVDSTVSAYLLKESGYEIEGIFMKNWDERDETGFCNADKDYEEVQGICARLCIPCRRVDFVKEYWNEVFSVLVHQYQRGLTPNPDILCNMKIKFNEFLKVALSKETSFIATGHYARVGLLHDVAQINQANIQMEADISNSAFSALPSSLNASSQPAPQHHGPSQLSPPQDQFQLLMSTDSYKDQTYFLAGLPQEVLARVCFPIGHLPKSTVKQIALQAGFESTATRKESMGICFIGKRNFKTFIQDYITQKPGEFRDLKGRKLGNHEGTFLYTIGQRSRVMSLLDRHYVVGKDLVDNAVVLASGRDHPALFYSQLVAANVRWSSPSVPPILLRGGVVERHIRTRHQQELIPCSIRLLYPGETTVVDDSYSYSAIGCVPWRHEPKRARQLQTIITDVPRNANCGAAENGSLQVQTERSSATEHNASVAPPIDASNLVITMDVPVRGIVPGQEVVIYNLDTQECEGGGHIADALMNHFDSLANQEGSLLSSIDPTRKVVR